MSAHRTDPGGIVVTQEMIRLYDDYTHLTLDRRRFVRQLTQLAGSSAAAYAVLPLLQADRAAAAMVAEDDPRLVAEAITWPGASGTTLSGYLARPAQAEGKLPAVMVVHENRGLNPHIKDVTRRLAVEGFLALGVDFLAPSGGTPEDEDKARTRIAELDPVLTVQHAAATVDFLKTHERGNGKVGAVGFCWGGGVVNRTAIEAPELDAAVAFYGAVPDAADVPKIRARMLLHYAGLDERINAGIAEYEAALKAAGVDYAIHMYEGVNHAFLNDTAAARYDKAAADLAWSRTVAFLKEALA